MVVFNGYSAVFRTFEPVESCTMARRHNSKSQLWYKCTRTNVITANPVTITFKNYIKRTYCPRITEWYCLGWSIQWVCGPFAVFVVSEFARWPKMTLPTSSRRCPPHSVSGTDGENLQKSNGRLTVGESGIETRRISYGNRWGRRRPRSWNFNWKSTDGNGRHRGNFVGPKRMRRQNSKALDSGGTVPEDFRKPERSPAPRQKQRANLNFVIFKK